MADKGTCIITGASRGIGAATARMAAAAGHPVLLNYAGNHSAAEAVAAEIAASGGRALVHQADIAEEDAVTAMFDRAEAELGPITALVNNAGILTPSATFDQLDAARLSRLFAVNITGSFLCAREAVRRMPGPGAIVNVSSRAAVLGSPNEFIDYAASKGAIDSMTIGLSKELGPRGIRVNAVRPGLIETEIHASAGDAGRVARMVSGVPMARAGSAEEVAEAILWLLSDEARYVTGTFIDVSGGR
ncbi:MAG: SDR family oxidoreductase [Pseudomonadota bacterium]